MDVDDVRVEEYDQDGKLVRAYVEQVPRIPPGLAAQIAALDERLHQMGMLADSLNPDATTNLPGARTQLQEIKRVLQAAKKM
jgi:hypothetical protein